MTDLLGGPEAWNEMNQSVSTMLKEKGWTHEQVQSALSTKEFNGNVYQLFGAPPGAKSAKTPEIAKYILEGSKVHKDVPSRIITKFDFISFLKKDEESIGGRAMRRRAKEFDYNLGLADAVWFLENQHLIPIELRGKCIIFPGTVLRDSDGRLNVPCLRWVGVRWILNFRWLDDHWYSRDRLVSCE